MTSKIPASKPSAKTAKRPAKAATPEIAAESVIPTLAADSADVKIAAEEAACLADATQAAAVDGLTALSREYAAFFEKSAEEASELMKLLWTAKSLPEVIEIGNKYGLDALAAYLAHLKRLQEIAAQSSGTAFEPFADVLESPLAWWKTAA